MKRLLNNKNFLLFFLLMAATTVLIYGCVKNPLNQTPTGQYTTGNYWRNQDDAIAGVLGIYNVLYTEDWTGHDLYVFDDQSNDISVDGDHPDFRAIERFNTDPSLQLLRITWPFAYEQIARANNAILYIPKIPVMDSAIRNRSMGEAYFLRAHAYFVLSQIFGDVPLILEGNVQSANYNVPKSGVDSIRKQVESDLLKAADLLPEIYGDADKGRVSKGAAWGMLCKLYMFEDKFVQAIQYGSNVINDPNYALALNYTDNFTLGKQETNTEILFAVWNKNQEIPNVPSSAISTYFTPRPWQGWGFHHPSENFVGEFEPGDSIRKRATILAVGDSIPNQTNLVTITDADAANSPIFAGRSGQNTGRMLTSMSTTGYCIRKYSAYMPSGDGNLDYDLKQPILRTSDVYLLVSEAKIRATGAGSGDAEINAVRKRAGLFPVTGAGMAQLIHERRVELGGENIRWQDLLRWDKDKIINLDTIVNQPKLAAPRPPYNSGVAVAPRVFIRPKHYYMPLPQAIIDESKGVIKQNPNY
jgi:hypothetical protein